MMNAFSKQVRDAVAGLEHCHRTCHDMAMVHCLETGGRHLRPQHLRLMQDCAALSAFTADAMGRKSQFHIPFALLCADVCDTCAQDCTGLEGMGDCATACRRCATSCRALGGPDGKIRVQASRVAPG